MQELPSVFVRLTEAETAALLRSAMMNYDNDAYDNYEGYGEMLVSQPAPVLVAGNNCPEHAIASEEVTGLTSPADIVALSAKDAADSPIPLLWFNAEWSSEGTIFLTYKHAPNPLNVVYYIRQLTLYLADGQQAVIPTPPHRDTNYLNLIPRGQLRPDRSDDAPYRSTDSFFTIAWQLKPWEQVPLFVAAELAAVIDDACMWFHDPRHIFAGDVSAPVFPDALVAEVLDAMQNMLDKEGHSRTKGAKCSQHGVQHGVQHRNWYALRELPASRQRALVERIWEIKARRQMTMKVWKPSTFPKPPVQPTSGQETGIWPGFPYEGG